jgi:uncharacterized protein YbjT (DUF2867 family)
MRRVLLLGATGLVGSELLTRLLDDPEVSEVRVVARRPTARQHAKLAEHVFELGEMERHADLFAADQIFCALGTTIKVAGSQERFRFVDHDLPLLAARLGLAKNARHSLLVSALGANARSRVFYNRVKGELENAVRALGYRAVTIARPSLLVGPRAERRFGEEVGKRLGWLMPAKYAPIEGADVARALVEAARRDEAGVRILESREMHR